MPAKKNSTGALPRAGRPQIPEYGISTSSKGLLPWDWAEKRLKTSREYWMVTTLPNRRPHVMPVWGIWQDCAFYFSTGRGTRKARNLACNPHCIVCNELAGEAVIVHGRAREVRNAKRIADLSKLYSRKYQYPLDPKMGAVYEVTPSLAFGMWERKFPTTATRWKF